MLKWRRLGVLQILGQLVYPPQCMGCGRYASGMVVCRRCRPELEMIGEDRCRRCGHWRPAKWGEVRSCTHCRHEEYAFSGTTAAFVYEGTARRAVHRLKFGRSKYTGRLLGDFLARRVGIMSWRGRIDVVVPVPLSRWGLWQRGFNQADILAERVARSLAVPLVRSVKRRGTGQAQRHLSAEERRTNLEEAFSVVKPHLVGGRRVLVVDDVFTTGATLHQMSRVLLNCGADEVWGAVAAR